jgi:hypothetical protein
MPSTSKAQAKEYYLSLLKEDSSNTSYGYTTRPPTTEQNMKL